MATYTHDLLQHISFLQEAVEGDRHPIAFLFGAGCPLAVPNSDSEPIIPAILGMTTSVNTALSGNEALECVVAGLAADGKPDANIEQILSCIRTLHLAAGTGEARGLNAADLAELERAVTAKIVDLVNVELPSGDNAYTLIAAWIQSRRRDSPVELFTTNYDLLAEEALERFRIPYFDGFSGSKNAFFEPSTVAENDLPGRWVRLWKLHGSANWREDGSRVIRLSSIQKDGHALIHPSHLKYDESRKMPYRALIDRLEAFLRQSGAVLVSIGYSYSDFHLNEAIRQGLESNPGSAAFGLMYGSLAQYPDGMALAKERSNLSLLGGDAAVVGCREGTWEVHNPIEGIATQVATVTAGNPTFSGGDFRSFAEFLSGMSR